MNHSPTTGRTNLPGDTIPRKFCNAVAQRGAATALRQKYKGVWQEMSWARLGEQARHIALGLVSIGYAPGEVAAILSNTRWEWSACDYGILLAGGVSCGIYPTDAEAQVQHLCSDSASRFVFVEDDEQLDKVLSVRAALPLLRRIVVIDPKGLAGLVDPQVMTLTELIVAGAAHERAHPALLEQRVDSRVATDLAVLIYTSGTTGKPKGAMLSHRNLCFMIEHYCLELPQDETDDKMAFLPLSHVAERVAGQFLSLQTGSRLNYVEKPETVFENLREISPTVFMAVPRIWEKLYSSSSLAIKEATQLQQATYAWAMRVACADAARRDAGHPVGHTVGHTAGIWQRLQMKLATALVLNHVRRFLGVHRMRWAVTGAAPISPELIRWYRALGIELLECFGMTESTGGGTLNVPGASRIGTVGRAQPLNEVRISEAGEIQIRGANVFMGYLNAPQKTAETIDADGWLHTGDCGVIDDDGFVKITDRMKDIIITSGGKNITPSEIENELKFSPYIADAVVIGDRRPCLCALLMIDQETVEQYAQEHDIAFSNFASLCRAPEVRGLIQGEVERVNSRFSPVQQIKHFHLFDVQLSAEDEELTPTLKLKRAVIQQKYARVIDALYATPH